MPTSRELLRAKKIDIPPLPETVPIACKPPHRSARWYLFIFYVAVPLALAAALSSGLHSALIQFVPDAFVQQERLEREILQRVKSEQQRLQQQVRQQVQMQVQQERSTFNKQENLTKELQRRLDETENQFYSEKQMWNKLMNETLENLKLELEEKFRKQAELPLEKLKQYVDELPARLQVVPEPKLLDPTIEETNWASERSRALIDRKETTAGYGVRWFEIRSRGISREPEVVLSNSVIVPGDCFALKGDKGKLTVELATAIDVKSVRFDHVDAEVWPNSDCAPKDFRVLSFAVHVHEWEDRGNFTFNYPTVSAQRFDLIVSDKPAKKVKFEIKNNGGNKNWTCIYRVRVFGNPLID